VDPDAAGPVAGPAAPLPERRRNFPAGGSTDRDQVKVEIDFARLLPILLAVFGLCAVIWLLLRTFG
jgi:hypothetical protein